MNVPDVCSPVSLAALRVEVEPLENSTKKRRFIRGPIDAIWIETAAKLPGKALHVAVALSYLNSFERTGIVKVKPSTLKAYGVDRYAKYRALAALANAGLISIEPSGRGKPKMVQLLNDMFPR